MSESERVDARLNKIANYEAFLNERLKRDLLRVHQRRDEVWEEQAEYLKLKTVVERVKSSPSVARDGLKSRVDLGCNFYAEARVDDPSRIFVDVGLGYHVELTLDEATKVIDERVEALNSRAEALTKSANQIKAQIRIVVEGIRELSNISREDAEKYRDVWA